MLLGKRSREPEIKFDPDKQYAIIRSSICTGEKVAGFLRVFLMIKEKTYEESICRRCR